MEKAKSYIKDQLVSLNKILTQITNFDVISEEGQLVILKNISRTGSLAREFDSSMKLLSEKFRNPHFVEIEAKVRSIQEAEESARTPENKALFDQLSEMAHNPDLKKLSRFKDLEKEVNKIREAEVSARPPEDASAFTEYNTLVSSQNEKVNNLATKLLNEKVEAFLLKLSENDFDAFYKAEKNSKLITPLGFTIIYETIVI